MQLQKAETNNAIIAKLQNVRKHSNADRLMLATVLGTQVIVGTDAKEGDLVVYFDSNLRLSDAYLKANNLYSNPEMNSDSTKKGYFGKNGKVKAQKLRGELSNGFVASLESLEDVTPNHYIDPSVLTEGVEFTHIDGVEICCKYVIPVSVNYTHNYKKKKLSIVSDMFHKHWDTKNINRQHSDLCGGEIYIEEKIHGCIPSNAQITMSDWTRRSIKDVKVGESVIGYNEKTNLLEPTLVLHTYTNGKTDEWLRLSFTYYGIVGGAKVGKIVCTNNHNILTAKGYKSAIELNIGDVVFTPKKDLELSDIQKEFVVGKLLGDGTTNLKRINKAVIFSHSIKQKAYFEYCCLLMGDIWTKKVCHSTTKAAGKNFEVLKTHTKHSFAISEIVNTMYTEGGRHLSKNILSIISPLSLAIWYCDNGSIRYTSKRKDHASAELAICRFDDSDVKIIKAVFSKYNLFPVMFRSDGYWRLRFNLSEAEKFFDLIKEYIPPCMSEKLPRHYRGFYVEIPSQSTSEKIYRIPQHIVKIERVSSKNILHATKYDIETGTHNYVAHGIVIHNSSGRTANVLCKTHRRWYQFWKPTEEWRVISGTRRIDAINAHLPLERRQIEEKVGPHLHKGEEIYYEIYGHTLSGGDIQSGFPYGCDMTQYKCMLYRVTITTPDGFVFDLDREAVYRRAAELGLEAPVVLGKSYLTNPITEDHLEHIRSFAEGRSTLDANTLREGVVVWFRQSNNQWSCLKHKSTEFLLLESKQRDDGIGDSEDSL